MADTSPCPRCQTLAKVSAKHPLCTGCLTQLVRTARQEQERDYLARWLSTRADDESKTIRRLRRVAEQQDIDWRHPPARMLLFDARLAALMALYRALPERHERSGRVPLESFRRREWPAKPPKPKNKRRTRKRQDYRSPPHTLTEAVAARIFASLANGSSLTATAQTLGLGDKTLIRWCARGRREADGLYHQLAAAVDGLQHARAAARVVGAHPDMLALVPDELRTMVEAVLASPTAPPPIRPRKRTGPPHAGGRPSLLTPETIHLVAASIRTGATLAEAAKSASVSLRSLQQWLAYGRGSAPQPLERALVQAVDDARRAHRDAHRRRLRRQRQHESQELRDVKELLHRVVVDADPQAKRQQPSRAPHTASCPRTAPSG